MIGKRFTRLIVLEPDDDDKRGSRRRFICQCDCGKRYSVAIHHLLSGSTKSCGCLRAERRLKHGLVDDPTYYTWAGMLQRCQNIKNPNYRYYGGRGITVHPAWQDFKAFLRDVGQRPSGHSLDRINNNGNYEPGNIQWATQSQQLLNRRNATMVTIDGVTKNITIWAKIYAIKLATLFARIRSGMEAIDALQKPVRQMAPKGDARPRKKRKSRAKTPVVAKTAYRAV